MMPKLGDVVEVRGRGAADPWLPARVTDVQTEDGEFEVELINSPGTYWSNGSGCPWRFPEAGTP